MTFRPLFFITAVLFVAACGNNDTAPATSTTGKQLTSIQWIDSVRNFGNISEGQKLSVSFRFKNTGNNPLVIESVHPSCGCTVAEYPKEPIKPGEEGQITGAFDSDGRPGQQHKELTITTNTPAHTQNVVFEVNVIAKAKQAAN